LYEDRTVQDWHRRVFGEDCWAIDLDLLGACRRCREPLYLIEATTNPNKPTSILFNLARRAHVPALIIWHDREDPTGARQIYPDRVDINAERLVGFITDLRSQHVSECRNPARSHR
jgi:hypothetical protein